MHVIYDLIYSHADNMYIAVPRNEFGQVTADLGAFDSRPPSGLYACTGIPTKEIVEVLSRHQDKHGRPLAQFKEQTNEKL